jgi:hypothetical protein
VTAHYRAAEDWCPSPNQNLSTMPAPLWSGDADTHPQGRVIRPALLWSRTGDVPDCDRDTHPLLLDMGTLQHRTRLHLQCEQVRIGRVGVVGRSPCASQWEHRHLPLKCVLDIRWVLSSSELALRSACREASPPFEETPAQEKLQHAAPPSGVPGPGGTTRRQKGACSLWQALHTKESTLCASPRI